MTLVLTAVAMWGSTAAAVSVAVATTGSAGPLWFMLIPAPMTIKTKP